MFPGNVSTKFIPGNVSTKFKLKLREIRSEIFFAVFGLYQNTMRGLNPLPPRSIRVNKTLSDSSGEQYQEQYLHRTRFALFYQHGHGQTINLNLF